MAVLYPENMISDWQEQISNYFQVPFCYCVHDKDLTTDGTTRKVHVHCMIALGNTTTYNSALSIFKTLQDPNKPTCIPNDEIRQVKHVRSVYNYFIHDTEDCKKLGKHLYDKSERITGNLFDIGSYEQLGQAEKDRYLMEITDLCFNYEISNFAQLVKVTRSKDDPEYFFIVKSNSSYFQALTKGIYLDQVQEQKALEKSLNTTT